MNQQECTSFEEINKPSKPKRKWKHYGVANLKRKFLSKMGFEVLLYLLLTALPASCQFSNFNHGLSSGDPAPGRSPGPPIEKRTSYNNNQNEFMSSTAMYDNKTLKSETDAPFSEWLSSNKNNNSTSETFEKIQNSEPSSIDDNICNYIASLDNEDVVTTIDVNDTSLNLTFEHSLFKSDTELVRGITYNVSLKPRSSQQEGIVIFTLISSVNFEERGDFILDKKDDHVCLQHLEKNAQDQHFDNLGITQSDRVYLTKSAVRLNKSIITNNLNLDDYDINTERNDLPVWESLNLETKNDIIDNKKLDNISEKPRNTLNNNEDTTLDRNEEIETKNVDTNNNKENDVDEQIVNNQSPSLVKKRRNVFVHKRDASNYNVVNSFVNEGFETLPGLYVDEAKSKDNLLDPEVVIGHTLYGKMREDDSPLRFKWKIMDSRMSEGRIANITFRLRYKTSEHSPVYQVTFTRILKLECQLTLHRPSARVSWSDIPRTLSDCQVFFPVAPVQKHGLLVYLERLNVPCLSGGFIRLSSGRPTTNRIRSHQTTHLCGKLEELPESERSVYFSTTGSRSNPYLHVHGTPFFVISYRLVDYCYNVTLNARNGSYDIEPTKSLHCTFRIHLPFGNRVALRLQMGEKIIKATSKDGGSEYEELSQITKANSDTQDKVTEYSTLLDSPEAKMPECSGLSIKLWDGTNSWIHCSKTGDPLRNVQIISKDNSVIIYVVIRKSTKSFEYSKEDSFKIKEVSKVVNIGNAKSTKNNNNSYNVQSGEDVSIESALIKSNILNRFSDNNLNKRSVSDQNGDHTSDSSVINEINTGMFLKLWYHAEPISDIVGQCSYGWVSLRQFCVSVFDHVKMPWSQAEAECFREKGHLVSIRNEQDQALIDKLLIQSPAYREQNAYWIGASDRASEGDFRWSDGLPFSFTHWFPGWPAHGDYNRQPNDDGLSGQDCVEIRRSYSPPAPARPALAPSHRWNDRDCGAPNYFICERPLADEPVENGGGPNCETTIALGRSHPKATLTSPGFPRAYPDGVHCDTQITAPPGYRIVMDFDELVLEQEPDCSYDFLEIWEPTSSFILSSSPQTVAVAATSSAGNRRRLCGDWSSRLKLLRHVSKGPRLALRFVSDYSHHYTGFKATFNMENVMECSDDRQKLFNDSCYLIVSYPEVTWSTALQICRGAKAQLAAVISQEEENFLTTTIRNSAEYSNSAMYWIGAKLSGVGVYDWTDGTKVTFSGWLPGKSPQELDVLELPDPENPTCIGIQWISSPTPMLPSGLYWTSQKCSQVGGYVCKRKNEPQEPNMTLNRTITDQEGRLTSPNYPTSYPNNLNYNIKLIEPENTRIVLQFSKIDMEYQKDCLYDFVEMRSLINDLPQQDTFRICGNHDTDMRKFDFVSIGRSALITVKTDYSITGIGFNARWKAVDVSACPKQILTAKHGAVKSPNWPYFLLNKLDCIYTITAPPGKRVWLEIIDHSIGSGASLEIFLGEGAPLEPFLQAERLDEGAFLSKGESLEIRLRTGDFPIGKGFSAVYKIVGFAEEERIIALSNSTSGSLLNVNYPRPPPTSSDISSRLVAPPGCIVHLRLHAVRFNDGDCPDGRGKIEVYDRYADLNGTIWNLCEDESKEPGPPLSITSYYNILKIRQRSWAVGVKLNASVSTQMDVNYHSKLMQAPTETSVENCKPNPCLNGGRCLSANGNNSCQCQGHFTGSFCALTACELEPCIFGSCVLTPIGYRCDCHFGYTGPACESKLKVCESRPCEGRGKCVEKSTPPGFECNCYAWWEGQRCERRMMNIPYRPLSERMLQEPFWLGLITVFIVLAIIGLVWCAKRHFPEKIEKLLAEESDRNRPNHLHLRSAGRDSALCQNTNIAVAVNASTPASSAGTGGSGGQGRGSLFNRLGIRKPSILSLSPGAQPAARTFSLDDLLRPPPRRTPSPRKKRNNSTPTKKNAAEKKQILQQLISPAASQNLARKVSMGELIQLSEKRTVRGSTDDNRLSVNGYDHQDRQESSFSHGAQPTGNPAIAIRQLSDPKLEKKVTFARLLNKVSAEMSSGSEIEMGGLSINDKVKASSTPPSPAAELRYPHSTCSNQGSDSTSSLETALPGMGLRRFAGRGNKLTSADSILAMFRNFSSSAIGMNMPSSIVVSPSTTPSISSPQDEAAGDDDSSTSSLHTPISTSSGAPDSPVYYRQSNSQSNTIEVPVLDVLSAHKATVSGSNLLHPPSILLEIPSSINKCLSPIRELPTPLPSPALTPIMHRSRPSSVDYEEKSSMDVSDDHISMEIPCALSQTEDEDDENHSQNLSVIARDKRNDSIISNSSSLRLKVRPSPIGGDTPTPSTQMTDDTPSPITQSHDSERECSSSCGRTTASPRDLSPAGPKLVIPLLTVEQPSPTRHYPQGLMFAGSPPPQRASIGETSFLFPNKQQQKRLLKEFEKPTSLDLATAPPLITITCNMSEAESDAEQASPAIKNQPPAPAGPSTMCYLSPFSMCIRGDRTTSESNLSSSGYSSMASPGPSRCGSNNPLCPTEMEDPGSGSGHPNLHTSLAHRRPSPLLKSIPIVTTKETITNNEEKVQQRGRSDSETLSDDPLLESNDEGISTDHLEERIEDGEVKSAKELEVFLKSESLDSEKSITIPSLQITCSQPSKCASKCVSVEKSLDKVISPAVTSKMSLQLPSIVIQADSISNCDKLLSPVSSRSESPLSDRTLGMGRFSPHFYGRHKDQLPFTDSDGLYDFPSSDCVQNSSSSCNKINMGLVTQPHRKSTGRRRERKNSRTNPGSKTPSPTKAQLPQSLQNLLDVPGKDIHFRTPAPRKLSPKRRSRSQQPVTSSSSSDSLNSARELTVRLTPETKSPQSEGGGPWPKHEWVAEASGEETGEDVSVRILPKSPVIEELPKPVRKISRMRTIGHQIRFLRRLEQSLKQKELFSAVGNSDEEGDESSSVTSPLLQQTKVPRQPIKKSQNIVRVQQQGVMSSRPKIQRQKKGISSTSELLQTQESLWRGNLGMAGPNDISD